MRSFIALFRSFISRILALFSKKDSDPVTFDPEDPTIAIPEQPVVCYYGCPNSKKAEKLQLSKTLYR